MTAKELRQKVLDDWSEEMEDDLTIQGSDAVEWLVGLYNDAKESKKVDP